MTGDYQIEWVDEPPVTEAANPKGRHSIVAAELRVHPGQWALVSRGVSPGTVSNLRTSKAYQPSADFEITSRKHGDDIRKRDVYIRFVGKAS